MIRPTRAGRSVLVGLIALAGGGGATWWLRPRPPRPPAPVLDGIDAGVADALAATRRGPAPADSAEAWVRWASGCSPTTSITRASSASSRPSARPL